MAPDTESVKAVPVSDPDDLTTVTITEADEGATKTTDDDLVAGMALYNLQRAHAILESLENKPVWDAADTASFDCMHYLGDDALENAASSLGLTRLQSDAPSTAPAAKIIDVGAGFGVTGRYLNRHFGAHVTGVELQAGIHAIAQAINYRAGLFPNARSVHKDFLEASLEEDLGAPFDGAVSMLCILHFPESTRSALFAKLAECLSPGTGRLYIEDMFALRKPLDERMKSHVACEYLPSKEEYIAQLEEAGFSDIVFDDSVTSKWITFLQARAADYKAKEDGEASLLAFYDAVNGVFADGAVGGVRISARLLPSDMSHPKQPTN